MGQPYARAAKNSFAALADLGIVPVRLIMHGRGLEAAMLQLTRQQQLVICAGLFLLLTGWAVKAWRMAKTPPPVPAVAATVQ